MLTITVDTLLDEADGSILDGDVSLRDAIALAPSGETIDFSVTGTILLTLGELKIDKDLTVDGPGAELLTIDASGNDPTPDSTLDDGDDTNDGDGSRVFEIDDGGFARLDVALSSLTLTGGDVTGDGGAVRSGERLALRDVTVAANVASGRGGGILGFLLDLERSTIADNAAGQSGGGIASSVGIMAKETTISGNTAMGDGGGAHFVSDFTDPVSGAFLNSTISGNTAGGNGGGLYVGGYAWLIQHSSIVGNTAGASDRAGGTSAGFFAQAFLTIQHTIVTGNQLSDGAMADLFAYPDSNSHHNLVGVDTGVTGISNGINGNIIGTPATPIDPRLGPLQDNGGPTLTHALRSGSPAIDAGDPVAVAGVDGVPEFDQRGAPFVRVRGAAIDIGAFEVQSRPTVEELLQQYVDDGVLNRGQANALAVKLATHGNRPPKPKRILPFINQVDAFVRAGILTSDQGNALIDAALQPPPSQPAPVLQTVRQEVFATPSEDVDVLSGELTTEFSSDASLPYELAVDAVFEGVAVKKNLRHRRR